LPGSPGLWGGSLTFTVIDKFWAGEAKLVLYFEREQELVNSLGIRMFASTWLDGVIVKRYFSKTHSWD